MSQSPSSKSIADHFHTNFQRHFGVVRKTIPIEECLVLKQPEWERFMGFLTKNQQKIKFGRKTYDVGSIPKRTTADLSDFTIIINQYFANTHIVKEIEDAYIATTAQLVHRTNENTNINFHFLNNSNNEKAAKMALNEAKALIDKHNNIIRNNTYQSVDVESVGVELIDDAVDDDDDDVTDGLNDEEMLCDLIPDVEVIEDPGARVGGKRVLRITSPFQVTTQAELTQFMGNLTGRPNSNGAIDALIGTVAESVEEKIDELIIQFLLLDHIRLFQSDSECITAMVELKRMRSMSDVARIVELRRAIRNVMAPHALFTLEEEDGVDNTQTTTTTHDTTE